MTWTCRLRDAAGNVLFDGAYRMGRTIGYVDVSSNGSMVVPAWAENEPFFRALPIGGGPLAGLRTPRITVSGTTITWTYSGAGNTGNGVTRIFLGVK